jgi:tripartite ATP-independent transporter DctM subunit
MIGVALSLLGLLIALSLPIGAVLVVLGLILSDFYSTFPLWRAIGETSWNAATDTVIVCVPMFILMGELLLRSGIADGLYTAMVRWLSWVPGGIMHANVGAATLFAATSGSSAATAATIGTVAMPEMKRYGYDSRLFLGSIAAGGTLGILIPPSINLVVYGVLTQTSIPKLYLAGFLPGFLLSALFMTTIMLGCTLFPHLDGQRRKFDLREAIQVLPGIIPPVALFLIVVGTIYAGIATPTEASSLGVVAALILAAVRGRLTWSVLATACEGTVRTTSMIMLIFVAAFFLNFVIASTGLTRVLNEVIVHLGWTPLQTMIAIIIFYLILGCFMETMAMMITTIPVIAPLVVSMGYDSVWFGIVIVVLVEAAMITPPVGVNLYIVHGIRRDSGSLNEVIAGASPFVLAMCILLGLLIVFPDIALFLPKTFE